MILVDIRGLDVPFGALPAGPLFVPALAEVVAPERVVTEPPCEPCRLAHNAYNRTPWSHRVAVSS